MWYYQGKHFQPEMVGDYVGFVYLITNKTNNNKYIGKKLFTKAKRKKRKRLRVGSDWQNYYGSNQILKQLVEQLGEDNFDREIIKLCASKSEMSYYEAKLQFENDVLLSDQYYNQWIQCKIRKSHLRKK